MVAVELQTAPREGLRQRNWSTNVFAPARLSLRSCTRSSRIARTGYLAGLVPAATLTDNSVMVQAKKRHTSGPADLSRTGLGTLSQME